MTQRNKELGQWTQEGRGLYAKMCEKRRGSVSEGLGLCELKLGGRSDEKDHKGTHRGIWVGQKLGVR